MKIIKDETPLGRSLFVRGLLFLLLLFCISLEPGVLPAQSVGVSMNEILIGQSCALKGPTKALGLGMRNGALAYFKHINESGGIHGKRIRLTSYDDGYEPEVCIKNSNRLIREDRVFLLFGYVGTPTSKVAVPIATEERVPFFVPFTGAEFLRSPLNRHVFNIRASYYQETGAMVDRLVLDRGVKRISVFYQDDSYGKAGWEGVRLALERRGMGMVNDATYPRNTMEVSSAVKEMLSVNPEAVIMIGAYAPCAEFIKQMRDGGSEAYFLNVSFVGADALAQALQNKGVGVVITQVVPFPFNKRIPVVGEYHKMIQEYEPDEEPNFVGMEGFVAAKALCRVLQETPEPLTREGFIQTAENQTNVDLGGFTFGFNPTDHQGSDLVYFSQVGPGDLSRRLTTSVSSINTSTKI